MPDHPTPTLHQAAEALLDALEGARFLSENRQSLVEDEIAALRAALASDAAWRARAEAAVEVADALWGVDVAWMAYEPSDDPNAGPNASQKRHTAAVARLNAARRRYEETCRAG